VSLLDTPDHQQAWNFPNKQLALDNLNKIKSLKKYHTDEVFKSRIDAVIKRMEKCQVDYRVLDEFFKFNDMLDQARQVKLVDYIPELEECRSYLPCA